MALDIGSQFFKTRLAHLRTDEEKATYWLDQWWGHGKNWSQLADLMGTTNQTAKSIINQIIENNPDFYEDWLKRLEEGAKSFMDESLGKTMYTYYMEEIRVCEREYNNLKKEIDYCRTVYELAKDDKDASKQYLNSLLSNISNNQRDQREWKKMKHQLMSKVIEVHLEVSKTTKSGGKDEDYPYNLDSKISRAASSVQ